MSQIRIETTEDRERFADSIGKGSRVAIELSDLASNYAGNVHEVLRRGKSADDYILRMSMGHPDNQCPMYAEFDKPVDFQFAHIAFYELLDK